MRTPRLSRVLLGLVSVRTHTSALSMTSTTPKSSFYRRNLPSDTCTAFASRAGRLLFQSALSQGGCKAFFHLMEQFTTQSEPAFCGISTLLMTLNALAVDPGKQWKGPWRWYDEQMLNCCIPLDVVEKEGITVSDFICLAHCQGLQTSLHYPLKEDNQEMSASEDDFRQAVRLACVEDPTDDVASERLQHVLVAAYSRKVLGQTGDGHFSPIAAYDPTSDSVLILDVARFKYGAHWVKLPLLYEALKPLDKATGRSRGFCILSYLPHSSHDSLPRSILFVSKMSQMNARQAFMSDFHQRMPQRWAELVDYYRDKSKSVWDLVEPLPISRLQEGQSNDIQEIRNLIHRIHPEVSVWNLCFQSRTCCKHENCNTISISAGETMFIIYLACLDREARDRLVLSKDTSASKVHDQLLAEAELIALALQESDRTTI